MYRVIRPIEIYEQVESIISCLDTDKEKLTTAQIETNSFMSCDELSGESWLSVKEQISMHNVVIRGLICMIDELLLSCAAIKINCGREDLDEETLYQQIDILENENSLYDFLSSNNKYKYDTYNENSVDNKYSYTREYYFQQYADYISLIDYNNSCIERLKQKIKVIDEIDNATQDLHTKVEEYQLYVKQALECIKSTWNSEKGTYVKVFGLESLAWYKELNTAWENKINSDNVSIDNMSDAEKLELSRWNDNIYISSDYQYFYYGGEAYLIYVPKQDGTIYMESKYEVVKTKKNNDFEFNLLEGICNIEFEDPDLKPVQNSVQVLHQPSMNGNIAGAIILDATIGIITNSVDKTDIKIEFQSCDNPANNRVIIYAGTYEQRITYNNMSYGGSQSFYFNNYNNLYVKWGISDAMYNLYNSYIGGDAKRTDDEIYDCEFTLSEDRIGAFYYSYLCFDSNGVVLECPIKFPGDRVCITKRESKYDISSEEILDITNECFDIGTEEATRYSFLLNSMIEGR